jgi:primary-amine oxidase
MTLRAVEGSSGTDIGAVVAAPPHPLRRLDGEEIRVASDVLAGAGLLAATVRVTYLGLEEPPKHEVLAWRPGTATDRRVRAILLDAATGEASDVIVSLTGQRVHSRRTIDVTRDGHPPIMLEDLVAVDEIVKADPGWLAAVGRRGITDLDLVRPCPLSAGSYRIAGEAGRRMLRVLSFVQHHPADHPWAHPVDGLVAYVDLVERRVVELIDDAVLPVPAEEGNADDPAYVGPVRTTLRPIEISQPEGPSFTLDPDGGELSWQGWRLRVGFDAREALTLHQISLHGRPIVYRASLAEMVVPYADPSPARFWQNYFDIGEYLMGQQVTSLERGCDCLGEIRYLDVVLPTEDGQPREVPQAICIHEEDTGVAWRHNDLFTGSAEVRRQRRLVISTFAAIGNYDYGFYWYLYLDGTIELEVKATGVVFTSAYRDGSRYATQIAPGLGAPYHQHLFCVRLDMTVDGGENAVDEVDLRTLPVGPENPHGNAFTRQVTRLRRESDGGRLADASVGRAWRVVNPARTNRFGEPVSYLLRPQAAPVLAADPASSVAARAVFATRHLWVTRYHPDERYPAGDLPNQHPGGAGLPAWTAADRAIDTEDIVVWHTFGMTHFPRPEEWPVMPVASCGFTLAPSGFFDRNPILDLPRGGGGTGDAGAAADKAHCHIPQAR